MGYLYLSCQCFYDAYLEAVFALRALAHRPEGHESYLWYHVPRVVDIIAEELGCAAK